MKTSRYIENDESLDQVDTLKMVDSIENKNRYILWFEKLPDVHD